jgi:hypothetical protein
VRLERRRGDREEDDAATTRLHPSAGCGRRFALFLTLALPSLLSRWLGNGGAGPPPSTAWATAVAARSRGPGRGHLPRRLER